MKDLLKSNLIQMIPFLGSYFVIYGCIDIKTYYDFFHVDIFPFLTISEILTYFLKDIFYVIFQLVLFFITFLVIAYFDKSLVPWIKKNKDAEKKTEESNNIDTPTKEFSKLRIIKIVLIIFLILIVLGGMFLLYIANFGILHIGVFVLNILFVLILIFRLNDFRIALICYLLFSLLTHSYSRASNRAEKSFEVMKNVDFSINNGELIRGNGKFFIGKTEQYIFIHDSTSNYTQVLSVDKLDWIKIESK